MKWIYSAVAGAMLVAGVSGVHAANERVRDLVLAVDREAIQTRQRAENEIRRQIEFEAQRLGKWVDRWDADAALVERLYEEELFARQARLEGTQLLLKYVNSVTQNPDQGVATPVGVRSERALQQESNDLVREIDSLKREIEDGTETVWLPIHGDTTLARVYEQINKARYDIERFRANGAKGDVVIKFPGPLGRVDGQRLRAGIAERAKKIEKIAARMDLGEFVVGGMPVLGMLSQRDVDTRIAGVASTIQSAELRLQQQQYYIYRLGLGQVTRRQLEKEIKEATVDLGNANELYGSGEWVVSLPGIGRQTLQELTTSLRDLQKVSAKLEEEVSSGALTVQLPGFAGPVDERGISSRLQALAGRTDAAAEREQRKLQDGFAHLSEYGRVAIGLTNLQTQRLQRLQVLQEPLYRSLEETLKLQIADLREFRPEFERDFREFQRQQDAEREWLSDVAEYYLP